MSKKDIKNMSDDDLLDMDYFLNEDEDDIFFCDDSESFFIFYLLYFSCACFSQAFIFYSLFEQFPIKI